MNDPDLALGEVARMWQDTEHLPVWVRLACRAFLARRALLTAPIDVHCLLELLGVGGRRDLASADAAWKDLTAGVEFIDEVLSRHYYEEWEAL